MALYFMLPLAVSGANPGMKKCKRGKGTMFTANFRRSAFNWPGKRRQVVTPDIVICGNRKNNRFLKFFLIKFFGNWNWYSFGLILVRTQQKVTIFAL